MSTPTLLAQSQILAYRCVKMTTTPGFVAPATSSTDAILGVTTAAVTAANGAVTLQENENGFVLLTAGGAIAAGDILAPTTNGSVVSASTGAFISTETAASGETLWAKRVGSVEVGAGIYGNLLASKFVQDVIDGVDSLDIVTVGDSNTGFYLGGTSANGQGYTFGLMTALSSLGATVYATPLFSASITAGVVGHASDMTGAHTSRLLTASITGALGNQVTLTAADAAVNADAQALKTFLGYTTDASLPQTYGTTKWAGAFVSSANFTSSANGNNIAINGASTLNLGSYGGAASCAYRMNRATFTTSGGGYRLMVIQGTNTIVSASSSDISTNAASVGYASDELTFNAPKSGNVPQQYRCVFDGYNQAGGNQTVYSIKGPFCGLWHSVIKKNTKGFAASNLIFESGFTTTQVADKLDNMGKIVEAYLYELRQRQISAGGSGRVMVWLNGGINDVSAGTPATYITGIERIRDKFRLHWSNLGYPAADLCFLFSTTHPSPTEAAGMATLRTTANTWATTNANDGNYVTMMDITGSFSGNDLDRLCLLNAEIVNFTADWAHLRPTPSPRLLETLPNYAALNVFNPSTASVYSGYNLHIYNNGYVTVTTKLLTALLRG
jgi:hypothetical protein